MKLTSARRTVCYVTSVSPRSPRSAQRRCEGLSELTMILRLLFNLLNNQQMVDKLAASRPIRRAAQITAYALTRAQIAGRDASDRVLRSHTLRQVRQEAGRAPEDLADMSGRLRRLRRAFMEEVKQGWRDGSGQAKK